MALEKFNINGTIYEYDIHRCSVRDGMMFKSATGLNLKPFSVGLYELDPDCVAALAWVLLTHAGVKGSDGQPIQLKDVEVDDMVGFFVVEDEPEPVDPTPGEPSTSPSDSTSPEPSTATP